MSQQPTLDKPDFPEAFDPVRAMLEYLRDRDTSQLLLIAAIVLICAVILRNRKPAETSPFPIDDEPLDAEDLASIAEGEAAGGTGYVSLDEYMAQRRSSRAS